MSRTTEELLAVEVAHLDAMHRHLERGSRNNDSVTNAVKYGDRWHGKASAGHAPDRR